jgi:hypothetical protein
LSYWLHLPEESSCWSHMQRYCHTDYTWLRNRHIGHKLLWIVISNISDSGIVFLITNTWGIAILITCDWGTAMLITEDWGIVMMITHCWEIDMRLKWDRSKWQGHTSITFISLFIFVTAHDSMDNRSSDFILVSGDYVVTNLKLLTPWLMERGGSTLHSQGLSNNCYPEPNQPKSTWHVFIWDPF